VRYVCPQKVVLDGEDDVTLYFRTTAPGRKTTLKVCDENGELAKRTLTATSPGTMEHLVIKADQLKGLKGTITVTAEHEEVLA
ncbi:MAG: pyridine nucleotide-disulfide oxidoreductase, partial [Firmicutes bacterium]|nr:pyridine nucleotide-disulfide oxidoreductase [Bacillota bacterium]